MRMRSFHLSPQTPFEFGHRATLLFSHHVAARVSLAAVDAKIGSLVDWNAEVSNSVRALAISNDSLYVGGEFSCVYPARDFNCIPRTNLAAFSIATGELTPWSPQVDGNVNALAVSANTVYAGGSFRSIGGATRNYLAAVDATTGSATSWNPDPDFVVLSLLIYNNTVYAGGMFTKIGAINRNYIAALDAHTGEASAWDPGAYSGFNGYVRGLLRSDDTLFVNGRFSRIGGAVRNSAAALSARTGMATDWNPNEKGNWWSIDAMAELNNVFYLVGCNHELAGCSMLKF